MSQYYPDHYSHKFKLKLDKLPAKAVDRFSRWILLIAVICGALLLVLGLYHFLNLSFEGTNDIEKSLPQTHIKIHTLVSPTVFAAILVLIGLGVILYSFIISLRYKIIFFNGDTFTVKNQPLFGSSYTFSESLYNYTGVRLRVKFYQFGIFNKNKFIIELYHKDPSKIIPLYINTSKHKIRKLWKYYAQELHMPALTISERGMVSRNFKDLDRPYQEVIAKWHLQKDFSYRLEKPEYITFKSKKSGEKMIKVKKLFFDAYSFLSIFTILVLGSLLTYALYNHEIIIQHIPYNLTLILYAFILSVIIYSALSLFTRDIIVISHDKLYIFRKIGFVRIRDGVINFKSIKGLDINYTPTSERYFLAIVTDEHTTTFGNKLPVEGLRWIRATLINEIISNNQKSD